MGKELEVREDIQCKRGRKGLRIIRIKRREIGEKEEIKNERKIINKFWKEMIEDKKIQERMIKIIEELVGNIMRK